MAKKGKIKITFLYLLMSELDFMLGKLVFKDNKKKKNYSSAYLILPRKNKKLKKKKIM